MRTPTRLAPATVPLLLLLAACGGGQDPYSGEGGGALVVGSANFPESTLLAHIYAKALEAEDIEVETQLDIGSREVYYDQIAQGNLSVFPEYNGGILFYLEPEAESGDTQETNEAVRAALPDNLAILESSPAQNKDSITVTSETAEQENLTTIGDLQRVAGDMTLGAPAEFETRPQGVPGLADTYGVEFGGFRPLEGNLLVEGLRGGDIQAANLFTTNPAFTTGDFVALEDPENLFGSQNVTPLINKEAVGQQARDVLNAVSAELTTETLIELDARVQIDHEEADVVAADWLAEAGLD
ncbi:ABC transporter substrate-binding protein [Streptomonospora litoralis]|uniref:Osmoprotectant uptake system substrate-binding protein OsmF n=1 Tax=Streptomonospora litoralis TaxID=2498135 RepID=A0A4P6Q149_9ACTN|nr:ABC transporter substrate-binding protein [Streptomonospora litoralis]QBI52931.1 Putative osmoprotectant uptake system substrate-binding protein OsmF precursor [Streptomonospora litoralis]